MIMKRNSRQVRAGIRLLDRMLIVAEMVDQGTQYLTLRNLYNPLRISKFHRNRRGFEFFPCQTDVEYAKNLLFFKPNSDSYSILFELLPPAIAVSCIKTRGWNGCRNRGHRIRLMNQINSVLTSLIRDLRRGRGSRIGSPYDLVCAESKKRRSES